MAKYGIVPNKSRIKNEDCLVIKIIMFKLKIFCLSIIKFFSILRFLTEYLRIH